MEDEVERQVTGVEAQLLDRDVLAHLQHLGLELDVARLVHAVDVAEGRGQQVALPGVAGAEGVDGGLEVLTGGVELLVDLVLDAVLLAADDADLDLEDLLGVCRLLEQLLGDLQVAVERGGRTVPHVGLEERVLAAIDALLRDLDERPHEAVELVLGAVVGVQRDEDVVLRRHHVRELGERDRAGDHVLDVQAGAELGTAGGELDDAIGPGIGEALDGRVDGLRGRAVDRRVGEALVAGPVEHVLVLFGSCDGHVVSSRVLGCATCASRGAAPLWRWAHTLQPRPA